MEDLSIWPQTANSALRSLEAKGLVSLDFEPGSRKNKVARLTEAGQAFSAARVEPALAAEQRAFERLSARDRFELVRLVGEFSAAVSDEFDALGEVDAR